MRKSENYVTTVFTYSHLNYFIKFDSTTLLATLLFSIVPT